MDNALRQNFFRAGHAHAGVFVILALICQILADSANLPMLWLWLARIGEPLAAILIPMGFFLSMTSPAATEPNALVGLVYVGAAALAVSVLTVGVDNVHFANCHGGPEPDTVPHMLFVRKALSSVKKKLASRQPRLLTRMATKIGRRIRGNVLVYT